ncbi:MAG: phosphodiesterase [Clostridia bacterium]
MKIMLATDIHGSKYFAEKLLQLFIEEKPDKLVILGDLYYHGPRNPLPREYAPIEVANLLNSIKDKLIVIKGNCDSEVDEMVSEFNFLNSAILSVGGRKVFLTHGHKFNKDTLPELKKDDILFYGHFHKNELVVVNGVIAVCIASISMPKQGEQSAYAILTDKGIEIKNLEKEVFIDYIF